MTGGRFSAPSSTAATRAASLKENQVGFQQSLRTAFIDSKQRLRLDRQWRKEAPSDGNTTLDGSTYPRWKIFCFSWLYFFSWKWKRNRLYPGLVLPPIRWWSLNVSVVARIKLRLEILICVLKRRDGQLIIKKFLMSLATKHNLAFALSLFCYCKGK